MSFKSIILSNPANLSILNSNLLIKLINTAEKVSVPIEDIAIVVLDNPQISITKEVLTASAKHNMAIITTDSTHMPIGIMLPCYNYFKGSHVLSLQISVADSLKNSLWQKIIQNKLQNQAWVLKALNKDSHLQIQNLINKVNPADTTNTEAIGARLYFISLFDNSFNRRDDNLINTMLNYGYAIVRSSIAKSLSSKGFHCSLGIHHKSTLNNFNLADDLIEPFRPMVDYYVYNFLFSDSTNLSIPFGKSHKDYLVNILNMAVLSNKGEIKLITATDTLVDSLLKCYESGVDSDFKQFSIKI